MKAKARRFNNENELVSWLNKQPISQSDILYITQTAEAWNNWVIIYVEKLDNKNGL